MLRFEERNETHVQVNRDLTAEFATVLSGAEWDVAMLQECPPRFAEPLARACGAEAHRTLTSRNALAALRALLARQNPDLMASGEGGSNLILVRVPGRLGGIAERREIAIHEGEPERRAMGFVRTASGICVANLHATNDWPRLAAEDVVKAARAAIEWAGGSPLVFGGDLNLRPGKQPRIFERLREEFGLAPPTAPDAIDHILCRGLEVVEPPAALAAGAPRAAAGGTSAATLRPRPGRRHDSVRPRLTPCGIEIVGAHQRDNPTHTEAEPRWRRKKQPAKNRKPRKRKNRRNRKPKRKLKKPRRKPPKKARRARNRNRLRKNAPPKNAPRKKRSKKGAAKSKAKAKASSKATSGLDKSVAQFRESLEQSVTLSRDRIQDVVDDAVKRGRMTRSDAEKMLGELVKKGRKQRDSLLKELERLVKQARKALP